MSDQDSTNSNPEGFATRRNGSCVSSAGEVDCGPTTNNFRVCCPHGAYCLNTKDPGFYNAACCSQPGNCTQDILSQGPYCANSSWFLFDNFGFFCCPNGTLGFRDGIDGPTSRSGCTDQSSNLNPATQLQLPVLSAKPKPSLTSGPAAGTIAGGVVGGVAALALAGVAIWLFLRRRQRRAKKEEPKIEPLASDKSNGSTTEGRRGSRDVTERDLSLATGEGFPRLVETGTHEMSSPGPVEPAELPEGRHQTGELPASRYSPIV